MTKGPRTKREDVLEPKDGIQRKLKDGMNTLLPNSILKRTVPAQKRKKKKSNSQGRNRGETH